MISNQGRTQKSLLWITAALLAASSNACVAGGTGNESTESEGRLEQTSQALVQGQAIFNVVDYGASPADFTDDTLAIQAAIDAAAANGGGTVYLPRGEYDISNSLVLPRNISKPLVLQGDGRLLTRITSEGENLASATPVITFSGSGAAKDYAFRDIMFGRRNNGVIFHHDQPNPGTQLRLASFERVLFATSDDPDGTALGHASSDLVYIRGAMFCTMDDVMFNGGDTALRLEESSHVSLRRLSLDQKDQVNHGIVLSGGDDYSIRDTWLQALDGGVGLSIEGGSTGISNVYVDGLSVGGGNTTYAVRFLGSSSAPVSNVSLRDIDMTAVSGPTTAHGIVVDGWTRNLRAVGVSAGSWSQNIASHGGKVVEVLAGAEHISVEGVLLSDPIGNQGLDDHVLVQSGSKRVHVEVFDKNRGRWTRDEGTIEAWSVPAMPGDTAFVGAGEVVEAGSSGQITRLLQGLGSTSPSVGQRLVLLGSAAAPVVEAATGGNLRLSSPTFTLGPNTTLQLVYDGTTWQEISRSSN